MIIRDRIEVNIHCSRETNGTSTIVSGRVQVCAVIQFDVLETAATILSLPLCLSSSFAGPAQALTSFAQTGETE